MIDDDMTIVDLVLEKLCVALLCLCMLGMLIYAIVVH